MAGALFEIRNYFFDATATHGRNTIPAVLSHPDADYGFAGESEDAQSHKDKG